MLSIITSVAELPCVKEGKCADSLPCAHTAAPCTGVSSIWCHRYLLTTLSFTTDSHASYDDRISF